MCAKKKESKKAKKRQSPQAEQAPVGGPLVPVPTDTFEGGQLEVSHTIPRIRQQQADVQRVALAHAEEKMLSAKEEEMRKADELRGEAGKLRTEASQIMEDIAKSWADEALGLIKGSEIATFLQFPKKMISRHSYITPCLSDVDRKGKAQLSVRIDIVDEKMHESLLSSNIEVALDKKVIDLLQKAADVDVEASKHSQAAVEWQKKLSKMDRLERLVNANISESELRSSEDGAALLDEVLANMDGHIAKLTR